MVDTPVLLCDENQGALSLASNPVSDKGATHLETRHYFIGRLVDDKRIQLSFALSHIMDLRHQSSAMCIIMLGGEDTHPWSATNVGNPIRATFPVDQ